MDGHPGSAWLGQLRTHRAMKAQPLVVRESMRQWPPHGLGCPPREGVGGARGCWAGAPHGGVQIGHRGDGVFRLAGSGDGGALEVSQGSLSVWR